MLSANDGERKALLIHHIDVIRRLGLVTFKPAPAQMRPSEKELHNRVLLASNDAALTTIQGPFDRCPLFGVQLLSSDPDRKVEWSTNPR